MGFGKTTVHEEVFVEMAKTAIARVENVVSDKSEKATLISIVKSVTERFAPQVQVRKTEKIITSDEYDNNQEQEANSVEFDLKLAVVYGANIPTVVANAREAIRTEVESISGYKVSKIDVTVDKLVKPEKIAITSDDE